MLQREKKVNKDGFQHGRLTMVISHYLEEDQVHGSAPRRLVVLLLEDRQALRQDVQRRDWLIHLSITSIIKSNTDIIA